MLIDTHAHIYLEQFEADFESMLDRARSGGVEKMVMPAIDAPSIDKAIKLCERHEGLYAMAAIHPSEMKHASRSEFSRVEDLARNPHVVAIGETGLDYHWDRSFDQKQRQGLRDHIQLAIERDLPVVFHNREATSDLLRIVAEEHSTTLTPKRLRGIFHCFTGSVEDAQRIRDLGFFIGIGGILTFKNTDLRKVVAEIPLEMMVLETDSPYLAPAPHRGKRNEPAYLRLVAEILAATKRVDLAEVERITTSNAEALFDI